MAGDSRGTVCGTGSVVGAATLSTSWGTGQTRAAPAVLCAYVMVGNAASTNVTCSTPAGWTLHCSKLLSTGVTRVGVWHFHKDAAGSDAAPSFTIGNAAGGAGMALLVDLTGLKGIANINAGGDGSSTWNASTTTTGTIATPAGTTTVPCTLMAGYAGRGSSVTMAWTAPLATVDTSQINSGATVGGMVGMAFGQAAASYTPAGTDAVTANVLVADAYEEAAATTSGALVANGAPTSTLGGLDSIPGALVANGAPSAVVAGPVNVQAALVAAAAPSGAVAGALTDTAGLTAAAAPSGVVAGLVSVRAALVANGAPSAQVAGIDSIPGALAGAATATGTVGGPVAAQGGLVAAAAPTGTVGGLVNVQAALTANGAPTSTLAGLVQARGALTGNAAPSGQVGGTLTDTAGLTAAATPSGTVAGGSQALTLGNLAGNASPSSTIAGRDTIPSGIIGNASPSGQVGGHGTGTAGLAASASPSSTVGGLEQIGAALAAAGVPTSSLGGLVTAIGAVIANGAPTSTIAGILGLAAALVANGTPGSSIGGQVRDPSAYRDIAPRFTPSRPRWVFTVQDERAWRFTPQPSRWAFTEDPMDPIDLAHGGAGYVGGIWEDESGQDISAAGIVLAIGDYDDPGAWQPLIPPHVRTPVAGAPSKVLVKLLIGNPSEGGFVPTSGEWLWGKLTDMPEITPRRLCQVSITYP